MPLNDEYAFASSHHNGYQPGMTIRQWYAGIALQALGPVVFSDPEIRERLATNSTIELRPIVTLMFAVADMMLKVGTEADTAGGDTER